MIVDAVGVLLRDDRGRSRAVPADSPAAGFAVWLLPMLRFDFAVLEKAFVVTGAREGEAWRLDLVPREGDLARALRGLAISGTGERVQHITIDRGDKRRVEIEMGDVRTGVTFGADEIGTYFRPDRR